MVSGLFSNLNLNAIFDSSGSSGDVQYGRYAALLSLKGNAVQGEFQSVTILETRFFCSDTDTSSIARGLCQHIIGLAPLHIR